MQKVSIFFLCSTFGNLHKFDWLLLRAPIAVSSVASVAVSIASSEHSRVVEVVVVAVAVDRLWPVGPVRLRSVTAVAVSMAVIASKCNSRKCFGWFRSNFIKYCI